MTHPDRELTVPASRTGAATITAAITGVAASCWATCSTPVCTTQLFSCRYLARDEAAAQTPPLWRVFLPKLLAIGGGITPDEHDAWVDELKRQIAGGTIPGEHRVFHRPRRTNGERMNG